MCFPSLSLGFVPRAYFIRPLWKCVWAAVGGNASQKPLWSGASTQRRWHVSDSREFLQQIGAFCAECDWAIAFKRVGGNKKRAMKMTQRPPQKQMGGVWSGHLSPVTHYCASSEAQGDPLPFLLLPVRGHSGCSDTALGCVGVRARAWGPDCNKLLFRCAIDPFNTSTLKGCVVW